jgi:uncharacterized protein (TIGR03067 family)
MLLAALIVVVATSTAARADDLEKLQGTWTTMIGMNKDIPLTMTIDKDGALTLSFTMTGQDRTLKGKVKLLEDKDPKGMDWVEMTADGNKLPDNLAIYQFDGDDTLKLRGSRTDKPERPTKFTDDPDNKGPVQTLVFKRQKKDKDKDEAKKEEPKKDETKDK